MRVAVLIALAAALAAGVWWFTGGDPAPVAPGPRWTPPDGPPGGDAAAPPDAGPEPAPAGPRAIPVPPQIVHPPPTGAPLALAGDVYLDHGDGLLVPGVFGSFRLHVRAGDELAVHQVEVQAGAFTRSVPERALLRVDDGVLNGQRVHFSKPAGPFEPRPERMALVGRVIPEFALRVIAAGTGADLAGVTVREVQGPGGARMRVGPAAEPEARGAALIEGAASPLLLPWIETRRPLWLEVAAAGYAPARALVDPRRPGARTFELAPAAGALTVHITGPGRGRVEGLVLQRLEGDAQPVAAHWAFARAAANAPDPLVFELEGLAAAPHLVRATHLDRAAGGAVQDLASESVSLALGVAARVVLYVPSP